MSAKRALVCSPVMPAYDRESGSRRIFNLVEFLREAGWEVSFAAGGASGDERYAKILQQRGVTTFLDFARIEEVIAANRFDLAILAFWQVGEELIPTIRTLSPTTRVIVDSIDLHFLRQARGTFLEPSQMLDPDYAAQMAREVNVYAMADGVLTVSQKEADLINDLIGDPTLAQMVPDSEDLSPSALPFAERKGILFIGNFRHPPNVEAAQYLCEEILPQLDSDITAEHPVSIVGNALDETVLGYGEKLANVRMVGWVPSMLPYLERARLSIVPLLHGAGTKRKLIQALMVGTPTVSTSIGVEGLSLQHGKHVLIADNPATFADSIACLLEDIELWERLARQGQAHITTAHGREAVRIRLMQTISSVLTKDVKSGELARGNSVLNWLGVDPQNFAVSEEDLVQKLQEYNEKLKASHSSLEYELRSLKEHNEKLKASRSSLRARNEKLQVRGDSLEHELQSIKTSRTWRLLNFYRQLRTRSTSSKKSG